MLRRSILGLLFFLISSVATWFLIPAQPRRVLVASSEADRAFMRFLPGGRWALTSRWEIIKDQVGRGIVNNRLAPIKLYDLRTAQETVELVPAGELKTPQITMLSPDGSLLAIDALQVWDLEAGKRLASMSITRSSLALDVEVCKFSPDSQFLAYLSWDSRDNSESLRLWSRITGNDVVLDPKSNALYAVAFSSDSKKIAIVVRNEASDQPWQVSVFNTADGMQQASLASDSFPNGISNLIWTPDGQRLVIVAPSKENQTAGVFDITSWNPSTGETKLLQRTSQGGLRYTSASLSSDGRFLSLSSSLTRSDIFSFGEGPHRLFGHSISGDLHPTAMKPIVIVEEPILPGSFSPGEISASQPSRRYRLWNFDTPIDEAPVIFESSNTIPNFEYGNDRSLLAIYHFKTLQSRLELDIWDTESARLRGRFNLGGRFGGFGEQGKTFFELPPYATAPGKPWMWDVSKMQTVRQWDVAPLPSWKWLLPAWLLEAILIGGVTMWLISPRAR